MALEIGCGAVVVQLHFRCVAQSVKFNAVVNVPKAKVLPDIRLSHFLLKRAAFRPPPPLFPLKPIIWISQYLTEAISQNTEWVKYLMFENIVTRIFGFCF